MTRAVDLSHVVFIDLLQNLVDTSGIKVAKGNLMRIAMKAGQQVEPREYESFEKLVEAMENGDTPLSAIEGNATYLGDGLFGLKLCPFDKLAQDYKSYFDKEPAGLKDLTIEFNTENTMAKEMKIGLGAGAGPFCIFHQPMRSQAGTNIIVAGKSVEIIQLACRSSNGEKAFAQILISEYGCDKDKVLSVMDSYTCCYGIRIKGS
ncbi:MULTISPECIES: hypothetical protein [Desulfosediminicola]|uniref:hypothetical protein n=1 Tax=Desulfosediminicola TaxID=2886823 RepID=UPI0010AC4824|nr:hypothetical protein [Desulfosediminicola ganghwensis]